MSDLIENGRVSRIELIASNNLTESVWHKDQRFNLEHLIYF